MHPSSFPYELGWVFIAPEARGNGFAQNLSQAAMAFAEGQGIFATSHTDNTLMHRTLTRLGFIQSGAPYPSTNATRHLQLFTRPPTKQ
ncbi:GNAT family N-acetyltransferase [Pseudomonas cavernicola]|uniref:GNAT family N-acetyltransferase n=1 Tax=Pseudomonas cavernicola TaxID=2320866 RepID=UPI003B75B6A4